MSKKVGLSVHISIRGLDYKEENPKKRVADWNLRERRQTTGNKKEKVAIS